MKPGEPCERCVPSQKIPAISFLRRGEKGFLRVSSIYENPDSWHLDLQRVLSCSGAWSEEEMDSQNVLIHENGKMRPVETIPAMRRGENKEE
jgi:hypothetical protein